MARLKFAAVCSCLFAFCLASVAAQAPVPAPAVVAKKYELHYRVRFLPDAGVAAVEIATRRGTGRLIALDLNMPADLYSGERGDGLVERRGDRVSWTPPREGGSLHYRVAIDERRANDEFDSHMTRHWVITRGDRLVPPANVRATKSSGSTARLSFELPPAWDDVETPFSKLKGGDFAVTDAEQKFDRPVGWIAAGDLSTARETIAGMRVTIAVPSDVPRDHPVTLAILRQALPHMHDAFGKLPEKLLIVRAGEPMWRGGLSAPGSLWLHASRPLLSANGTSPLLHELTHVLSDIHGDVEDDWISEGLAEFYSLEFGRRAKLISQDRFDKAVRAAGRSGATVRSLRGNASQRDRTRKAVSLFAALDLELRAVPGASIDVLAVRLMRRKAVSLGELRADAARLLGQPSRVLAEVR